MTKWTTGLADLHQLSLIKLCDLFEANLLIILSATHVQSDKKSLQSLLDRLHANASCNPSEGNPHLNIVQALSHCNKQSKALLFHTPPNIVMLC